MTHSGHRPPATGLPARLGVFGGTFDPIHNGHLAVAGALAERFAFDELLFVPAHVPPHKRGEPITHACHRFAMAALATADRADWGLSTLEVEAPERPYSVDTIARLGELRPRAVPLYFIIGADQFEDLPTWHEPLRLVESCHIIVTARPGHRLGAEHLPDPIRRRLVDLRGTGPADGAPAAEGGGTRIYLTEDAFVDLSSTAVREAAREGRPYGHMVPAAVAAYIEKHNLYGRVNE
jgi:nicotinate-nucleotide adenylyltransferase